MPTQEYLSDFYSRFIQRGGSPRDALAYMSNRGWIQPVRPVTEMEGKVAEFGETGSSVVAGLPRMTGMEKFAARAGEEYPGFAYDINRAFQKIDELGLGGVLPGSAKAGVAMGVAMAAPVREGIPQWRQDLLQASEVASEESTIPEKIIQFLGIGLIDLAVGSKGKILTKPMSLIGKRVVGKFLGDDFLKEGFLSESAMGQAFTEALVDQVVDDTSRLGASVSVEMAKQRYIHSQMRQFEHKRISTIAEFEDAEKVVNSNFLSRFFRTR